MANGCSPARSPCGRGFDASDIVQEALAEAAGRLPDYLSRRPLPFYPWLRHIAWQHLQKCHQRHIGAQRRSVDREGKGEPTLTDESAAQLVDRLVSDDTSASGRVIRAEERQRLRAALALLPARDREALVLRHLEQLSTAEIGAVLGISAGAVMTRHTRAWSACGACSSSAVRRNRREGQPVRNRGSDYQGPMRVLSLTVVTVRPQSPTWMQPASPMIRY